MNGAIGECRGQRGARQMATLATYAYGSDLADDLDRRIAAAEAPFLEFVDQHP